MNLYDILLARCICGNKSEESIVATPLEVTENGTYEAEEGYAYNPVTVNVSCEFSTARVTLDASVAPSQIYMEFYGPYVADYIEVNGEQISSVITTGQLRVDGGTTETFTVPISSSGAYLESGTSIFLAVSGDAILDYGNDDPETSSPIGVLITGDCTISMVSH